MTLKQNSFEGGTNGSNITGGTSGGVSGDAFTLVAGVGGSNTVTWSNTHPAHGSLGAKITGVAGGSPALVWSLPASTSQVALRAYFYMTALPPAFTTVLAVSNSTKFASVVYIEPTGKVRVDNNAGVSTYEPATTLAINTLYRFEHRVAHGASSTTGTIKFDVYAGDSTSALMTFTTSTTDMGTTDFTNVQYGLPGGESTWTFYVDDVAVQDGTTTAIGPVASNAAPTANAGPDQSNVEPWATVLLDGSASSDSDGTIASYAWTQTAGTTVTLTGSGATRTYIAPGTIAGETETFSLTVTDNGGATSTADTVNIAVLPVTERAVIGGVEVPMQVRTT